MATAPPSLTPLGTPPTTADPVNFDSRMDAFLSGLPTLQTEQNALSTNVYANAVEAFNSATASTSSASSAAAASANTAALANFKGTWASQTGAIAKPASVSHNGAFWALLNNLANVTTSQPGVAADWVVVGGAFPVVPINTNTTAAPWTTYLIYGACTLTLPASPAVGAQVGVLVLAGVTGAIVNPGAQKIRNVAGSMTVDAAPFSATLTYTGSTYGWV